jgi:hypothetical protein
MRVATVWKYCEQQWFQNMIKEVLCAVTVPLSHQTDDVESIESPSDGQYEFLGPDLSFHLLIDIISRCDPSRRMKKSQSKPILIPSHKSLNFIFLMSLENWQ